MLDVTDLRKTSQPSPVAIWAGMLVIYVVWGSTYLAIRFAVETIPPFYMAAVRFLVSGLVLYSARRALGDAAPTRREWCSAIVIGFFLLLCGNGSVVWAEQQVPSGLTALIIGTVPLWMILLSLVFHKEHPSIRSVIAVGLGFVGILMLFWPLQPGAADRPNLVGIVALIFGSCSWAFGSLFSRGAELPKSSLLGTSMEMIAGGVGLAIVGIIAGDTGRFNLQAIELRSLLGFAYLVVFGSLIGFATYTWLLRTALTSLVSTYAYVNPLVAIILGYLIADETLGFRTLVSAAVILGSVVLITSKSSSTTIKRAELEGSVLSADD